MDIKDYLGRIGLHAAPSPTLDGLHQLQDHHMRHVPFENLDVIMGRRLNLDNQALFIKIVTRRRGGYCFELNTLYAHLLSEIGFKPIPMMARVWLRDPHVTPPRTHLVYRVNIEGEDWISDVGFGGRAARVPIKILDGYEIDDGDGQVRVMCDEDFGYRIQRLQDGVWSDQYTVEYAPAPAADILMGNHWTEYHPDSYFRQGIGVGLFTPEGRTSFYNGILVHRGRETHSKPVTKLDDIVQLLDVEFGLELEMSTKERARLEALIGP